MNRIFRIVWNKAISQLVVTSELGRRTSGGCVTKRAPRDARATVLPLAALAAALCFATPAFAGDGYLAMPAGSLLDINNAGGAGTQNTADVFKNYTVTFTPTETGNNYILFAFRQDPAYWTFGNVGLYAAGDTSTNLFTNPLFTQGGQVPGKDIQAPAGWGVVYQAGTEPYAAGTWHQPGDGDQTTTNVNTDTAGSWYDGAVGSFDGIYQGVDLVAGITYTISFTALSNDPANVAGSADGGVEMGVYAGKCIDLLGPVANCTPDNPEFLTLATPQDAENAGGPSVVPITGSTPTTTTGLGTTDGAFDGGTLTVDQDDAVVDQDFTVSGNGGTIDQNGRDSTFTGTISDAGDGTPGDLTVVNSGTGGSVTLTGENTYTGGTTVDDATVSIDNGNALGTGTVTLDDGTLNTSETMTFDNGIDVSGTGTVDTDAGTTLTYTGTMSGDGDFVKDGTGTLDQTGTLSQNGTTVVNDGRLVLSGDNTYTGPTVINGDGVVEVSNDTNLGSPSGALVFNGGTLDATGDVDSARNIDVSSQNGNIWTDEGTTFSTTGDITGAGGINKEGDGTLRIDGDANQNGGFTVADGTLVLNGNNQYSGPTTVASGATVQVNSGAALGSASGAGVILVGGTLATTGDVDTSKTIGMFGSATLDIGADTTTTSHGDIGGTGTLVKTGDGTLVLDHANSYAGDTRIDEGTLQIADDTNLGVGGSVIFGGGSLHTTGDVDSSRNLVLEEDASIDTDGGTRMSTSGTVSGTGGLVKDGDGVLQIDGVASHSGGTTVNGGTLVLTGQNTYTGGTVVNEGATIQIGSDANLGDASGSLTLNDGTLQTTAAMASGREITVDGTGSIELATATTFAHSGSVGGDGDLKVTGNGALVQSGTLDQTGATIADGAVVVLNGTNNTYGGGTYALNGGNIIANGDGSLGRADGDITLGNGGKLSATGNLDTSRDVTLDDGGRVRAESGNTTTLGGTVSGDGGLTAEGLGTIVLDGDNTYTGGTTIQNATVAISTDANLGDASGGITLDGGHLHTTGDIDASRGISVTANDGSVETDAGTTFATSGGVSGAGGLEKDGEGTLRIDGDANQAGGVLVNDGTLILNGDNQFLGAAEVADGATLQVNAAAALGATPGGPVVLDNGTLATTGDVDTAKQFILTNGGGTLDVGADTTTTLRGIVNGSGTMVKSGDGTLVLSGADNFFHGDTQIDEGAVEIASDANLGTGGNVMFDDGTLHTTEDMASGRDFLVSGTATVDTDGETTFDHTGNVSGDGDFVKTGEGTLVQTGELSQSGKTIVDDGVLVLGTTNSYLGDTVVNGGGTVQVSSDGNLGDATSNVQLNGGTLHATGNVVTSRDVSMNGGGTFAIDDGKTVRIDGGISGTGGLTQEGGQLILTRDNSYTGGTSVTDGTLFVYSDGALGTGSLALDDGTLHVAGNMLSARDIDVSGTGTVTTDSGIAYVHGGSVTGTGDFVAYGHGQVIQTGAMTQDGATISDGGQLILDSVDNSYAGGTQALNGGIVQVSSDANLGAAEGDITLGNGGILYTTSTMTTSRDVTLVDGGATANQANETLTLAGTISGNGGLTHVGQGTLVLAGANTYTGGTTVGPNSVISVSGDANLGDASGSINLVAGELLATGDVDSARDIHLSLIGGLVGTDAGATFSTSGGVSGDGTFYKAGEGEAHVEGDMNQAGGVHVMGGTLVLGGNNAYTGPNIVDDRGTLEVSSDANLGVGGDIVFNGGMLHTTGDVDATRNIVLDDDGYIDVDAGTHMATGGTVSGSGALVKDGKGRLVVGGVASHTGGTIVNDGTLVLTANNTYTGGNTINGGTLQVQADANLGDASNGIAFDGGSLHTTGSFTTARDLSLNYSGTIATDVGTTVVATGNVGGAAGLVKEGKGTLDISGALSQSGGSTVNAGTLILGGDNTYTGGTRINGGTLQVSSDANLGDASNDIAINGGNLSVTQTMTTDRDILIGSHGASITTATGVTLNQKGDMSGDGGLVKLGGGTLVVYGNNTFTGGTLIQGGVIRINSGSSLGTGQILLQGGTLQSDASLGTGQEVVISGDSGVNVAEGTTTVLSGNLVAAAGNGCFVKSGKGYLSLTGHSSLASGTCVQEGVLSANGELSSSYVQVDKAAMLRGTGVIAGPVNVEGRLAAGNSPGTLTVAGPVTMQAGSTLQVDIDGLGTGNGAGNYSRVLVVGEGNRFVANGTLAPTLRGITGDASNTYTPALGDTYRIVTADGGVEGRFSTIEQPTDGLAANTRFLAFYGANAGHSIDLRVAPVSYAGLLGANAKRNGLAAAGALDDAVIALDAGSATAAQDDLLYAVSSLGADGVASMVNSLSGEVHADQAAAARNAGLGMQRDVSDHLGTDTSADVAHNVWANVTRDGNRSIADGQGSGFETGTDRTTGGIDLFADNGTTVGVAVTHHDTNVIARGGSASIRGNSGIVYAQQVMGRFVLDGMAAYGTTDWTTRRADPMGGVQLETRTSGKDSTASATLRMPMQTAGGSRIEPYASVVWQKVERDAVSERGSVAALSLDKLSETGTRVLAGVTMGSRAADPLASTLTWRAGVAVGADTGGLLDPTVHDTLAGQRFDSAAPGVGRGFVQVNANGTMRLGKSTYLYGGLTAEEGSRRSAYGVTAGVRVAF